MREQTAAHRINVTFFQIIYFKEKCGVSNILSCWMLVWFITCPESLLRCSQPNQDIFIWPVRISPLQWCSQHCPTSSKASWDRGSKMQDATSPVWSTGSPSENRLLELAVTLTRHPKIPVAFKNPNLCLHVSMQQQSHQAMTKWLIKAQPKIGIFFLDFLSWSLCVILTH